MTGMMDGTGWKMPGAGLIWLLVLDLLVIGTAALVKDLRR